MRNLAVRHEALPVGLVAIPVRTRLLHRGDDLVAVVREAVRGIAAPGDVLAISETAVAIAQGAFVAAEAIRPSKLAFALARRAHPLATVNQPESMQLVIDDVGVPRVLQAVAAQVLGLLVGKRGRFYEMLGDAITAIDGYTGTMPPYERAIVLAPREPDAVAERIAAELHCGCAIVDVNDLHRAKVLGASAGIAREATATALLENPHGNGDEQTPIVVLKWRGTGAHPLYARETVAC